MSPPASGWRCRRGSAAGRSGRPGGRPPGRSAFSNSRGPNPKVRVSPAAAGPGPRPCPRAGRRTARRRRRILPAPLPLILRYAAAVHSFSSQMSSSRGSSTCRTTRCAGGPEPGHDAGLVFAVERVRLGREPASTRSRHPRRDPQPARTAKLAPAAIALVPARPNRPRRATTPVRPAPQRRRAGVAFIWRLGQSTVTAPESFAEGSERVFTRVGRVP